MTRTFASGALLLVALHCVACLPTNDQSPIDPAFDLTEVDESAIDFPFEVTRIDPTTLATKEDEDGATVDGATVDGATKDGTDEIYEATLEAAARGGFVGFDGIEILASRSDVSIARLREALAALWQSGDVESRVAALEVAQHLAELGAPDGLATMRQGLDDDAPEVRRRALSNLASIGHRFSFESQDAVDIPVDMKTRILEMVGDPNPKVAEDAVQAAGVLAAPGVVARFHALVPDPDAPDRARIAFWLTELDRPETVLPVLAEQLPTFEVTDDLRLILSWLATLVDERPDLAPRALDALESVFEGPLRDGGNVEGYGGHFSQQLVGPFAAVASERSLPALQTITERAKDPVSRGDAHVALTRLRPDEALPRLREMMAADEPSYSVVRSLELLLSGKTDTPPSAETLADANAFLVEHAHQLGHSPQTIDLLARHLASEDRALLDDLIEGDPISRFRVAWQDGDWHVDLVLRDAQRVGLIRGPQSEERFAAAQAEVESWWADALDGPDLLLPLLEKLGVVYAFDAESDMVPSPHEELVEGYAALAGDLLQPRDVRQDWVTDWQPAEDEYEDERPLEVQFVEGDRHYRFEVENFGDWFDTDRVHRVMNRVLADGGHEERFYAWKTNDQVAFILFGHPAQVTEFATRWSIPLGQNPSSSRLVGQTLEAEVRRQVTENGGWDAR